MVTRGDRMLRRCGYVPARNGDRLYIYAGRADIQEETCECLLELSEYKIGRWSVCVINQFGDEGPFGLTSAEMEAVAVKIRELEKEREKAIRKRLRAWAKNQRIIRRAAKRKTK